MPAKKKPAGSSDRDWLLAAWEWSGDLSKAAGKGVRVSMVPSKRVGCWKVVWAAVDVVDGRIAGVVAKHEAEYPTGEVQSWAAFMFNGMLKLDSILAQEVMGAGTDLDQPVA